MNAIVLLMIVGAVTSVTSADYPCPEIDIAHRGNNIRRYGNVNTWVDCSNHCRDIERCHGWGWVTERHQDTRARKLCFLKNSNWRNGRVITPGVISGSRECGEWGIVEQDVKCAPADIYTHDVAYGCDGWYTTLQRCKESCENNAIPKGCNPPERHRICNYAIFYAGLYKYGRCHLATSCTKQISSGSVVAEFTRGAEKKDETKD